MSTRKSDHGKVFPPFVYSEEFLTPKIISYGFYPLDVAPQHWEHNAVRRLEDSPSDQVMSVLRQ